MALHLEAVLPRPAQEECRQDGSTGLHRVLATESLGCDGDQVWPGIEALDYTEPIRRELPALVSRRGFTSILDLPCGDFHWFQRIDLPAGVRYIGADIVEELTQDLQRAHGSSGREFIALDAVSGQLPTVDLWICRDLIFHLPDDDVLRLIDNFIASGIGHLLITSHADGGISNKNTFIGGFRLINLMNPPFRLPQPLERLIDYVDPHPQRYLLLYSQQMLADWRRARIAR